LKLRESLLWGWLRILLPHLPLLMMEMMSMGMMDKLVRGRMAWILTEVLSLEMLLLVLLW
jgi:hypothetical protein